MIAEGDGDRRDVDRRDVDRRDVDRRERLSLRRSLDEALFTRLS